MANELLTELLGYRVVVILRGVTPEEVIEVCEIVVRCGGRFLEVPLNTPRALDSIRKAARHFGAARVHIGAGTVLSVTEVEQVAAAGGTYVVSPNTAPAVIVRTRQLGLLSMPGFMTPTEAFSALEAGAEVLKCFPCGSPENIAVLKSVVPTPVFAVGGISRGNRDSYLAVADGVGVGVGIYRPGMSREELGDAAARFFEGLKG